MDNGTTCQVAIGKLLIQPILWFPTFNPTFPYCHNMSWTCTMHLSLGQHVVHGQTHLCTTFQLLVTSFTELNCILVGNVWSLVFALWVLSLRIEVPISLWWASNPPDSHISRRSTGSSPCPRAHCSPPLPCWVLLPKRMPMCHSRCQANLVPPQRFYQTWTATLVRRRGNELFNFCMMCMYSSNVLSI